MRAGRPLESMRCAIDRRAARQRLAPLRTAPPAPPAMHSASAPHRAAQSESILVRLRLLHRARVLVAGNN